MIINLDTENGASIASAYRGPDSQEYGFQVLKAILTKRFRALVSQSHVARYNPKLTVGQRQFLLEELQNWIPRLVRVDKTALIHYTAHIGEGLRALELTTEIMLLNKLATEICYAVDNPDAKHLRVAIENLVDWSDQL